MLNIILFVICIVPIVYYISQLKKIKLDTKTMIIIALFACIHFVLSKTQFIQYPQGGGFNMLASLPILLIGVLYGPTIGMTCGLVSGLITLIGGQLFIVHPAQFLLDYILPTMLLGLSGILKYNNKKTLFLGCMLAVSLKVTAHVVSGCIYFSGYAPDGWNPLIYSLVYNLTGEGIEAFLSSIIITIIPIEKVMKMANISKLNKAS